MTLHVLSYHVLFTQLTLDFNKLTNLLMSINCLNFPDPATSCITADIKVYVVSTDSLFKSPKISAATLWTWPFALDNLLDAFFAEVCSTTIREDRVSSLLFAKLTDSMTHVNTHCWFKLVSLDWICSLYQCLSREL